MESPQDAEIREHLRRYVADEITLDEFENWFVPKSWNIHQMGDVVWQSNRAALAEQVGGENRQPILGKVAVERERVGNP